MTRSEWSHPRAGLLMKLRLLPPTGVLALDPTAFPGEEDDEEEGCCISLGKAGTAL